MSKNKEEYHSNNFNIDIKHSIDKGWLKLTSKESWISKFDRFIVYFMFLTLFTYATVILVYVADFSNVNDKVFSVVLGLIILFALHGLYRKIVENRLTIIHTDLPMKKIKPLLVHYLHEKGFEIKVSKNCLVGRRAESIAFNNSSNKHITFIYADSYLGFTITKEFPKVNPPVFFTHYLIRNDLKELLNPKNNNDDRMNH